jgi:hypothetical protein
MKTKKIVFTLFLSFLGILIFPARSSKLTNYDCIQCWTCANCKKVLYKTVEVRPSMKGCSQSLWGHNWAYQGCLGQNIYQCRRCRIKINVDDYGPVNIKSDNCVLSSDDDGQRHQFLKIN